MSIFYVKKIPVYYFVLDYTAHIYPSVSHVIVR
jgi:hypothetical protein